MSIEEENEQQRRRDYIEKRKTEDPNPPPRDELDKFQVTTARFIDTLHGYLNGNHAVTTIDNARATCELISHLAKYFQAQSLIPSDLKLVYKFHVNEGQEPERHELLAINIRKGARASSNFSKHADRDPNKTRAYDDNFQLEMLLFNMIQDYEALHCALITNNLLDLEKEKLYKIKNAWLLELNHYKNIFHPYYASSPEETAYDPIVASFLKVALQMNLTDKQGECMVPAAAAACAITRAFSFFSINYNHEKGAEEIKQLGIHPVNTQTNSRIRRDLGIIESSFKPEPSR